MDTTKEEPLESYHFATNIKLEEEALIKTAPFGLLPYNQLGLMANSFIFPWANHGFLPTSLLPRFTPVLVDPLHFRIGQFYCPSTTFLSRQPLMGTPIQQEESSPIPVKVSDDKSKKRKPRVSACKNYIGLVCAGFSRSLLTAENNSVISHKMSELVSQKKKEFKSLQNCKEKILIERLRKEIYKTMCGKKSKKLNQERDFKIRNTHELDNLLILGEHDDELTSLRKEVVQEMIQYFFNSHYYDEWVSNGMMSETNRLFFIKNKEEIYKKFKNPRFYKPHFNYTASRELLNRQHESS